MLGNKVIRITFLISIVGHLLFLGMPAEFKSSHSLSEKSQDLIVRIEIERPTLLPKIEKMGKEKKLKEVIEEPKPLEPQPELQPQEVVLREPETEPSKDVVTIINPAKEAMLRYQDMVKQRIQEVRRYPSWAKRQGFEGAVGLRFEILSNGNAQEAELIHSSGFEILDQEAIATIVRASPFPPLPSELVQDIASVEVTIIFKLK